MTAVEDWPGSRRRRPPRNDPTYALLAPLARWLEEEAPHAAHGPYRVLDVGCGEKPYYPFFEPYVSEYVGVDVPGNPAADLQGRIEELPVGDASFDVVLCTQVLEHCDDPAKGVRELRRVLAPGGRALVSTHGVQVYHPSPDDLWRWTHAGLERLFSENGDWRTVEVRPATGTTATLAMLIAIYLDLIAQDLHVRRLGGVLVRGLNAAGAGVDRTSGRLRGTGPGSLHANYHVVAEAPA